MISQRAMNYARILYSLKLQEDVLSLAKDLLLHQCELINVLENPVIGKQEKDAVIDRLLPKEMANFLKVLCENKAIGLFSQIMEAYDEMELKHKNVLKAKFTYVLKPSDEEITQIKDMLCSKYEKAGVDLELEEDASLIGGYILYVGDTVYDKSIKGALSDMHKTLNRR